MPRRLFIAVPLPSHVQSAVSSYSRAARLACPRAAFSNTFHITLAFLGETPDSQVDAVKSALASVVCAPFGATLSGNGFFPNASRPRVFWLGVQSPGLMALQSHVAAELKLPREAYSPHITVARTNLKADAFKLIDFSKAPCPAADFVVDSFSLYSSVLSPPGARHEAIATYPLAKA